MTDVTNEVFAADLAKNQMSVFQLLVQWYLEVTRVALAYLEQLCACSVELHLAVLECFYATVLKREHYDLLWHLIGNELHGFTAQITVRLDLQGH